MKHNKITGFTLVELNLSMIFVALLVIGVAAVTINVTKINQRGILLKTINQTGREVTDQMRRDLAAATMSDVEYVAPVGGVGRLCLGTVSYVFNTAEALNGGGSLVRDTTKAGQPPVMLVRMDDKDALWCEQSGGVFSKNEVTTTDAAVELLQTDLLPVAIHDMNVEELASVESSSVSQGLMALTILIGTNKLDTIDANSECKPPTDHQSDFDSCAVREFRTVVRSNGVN